MRGVRVVLISKIRQCTYERGNNQSRWIHACTSPPLPPPDGLPLAAVAEAAVGCFLVVLFLGGIAGEAQWDHRGCCKYKSIQFTGRVGWVVGIVMTGFDFGFTRTPKQGTAHAGKTPGTFGGCGSSLCSSGLQVGRDSGIDTGKTDTRCVGFNAQHKPSKIPTTTEGGLGYSCVVSAAFGYRWISTRVLWCCGSSGGFSVSGCFRFIFSFLLLAEQAGVELCTIVLTDAETGPTDRTHHLVGSYDYLLLARE